MGVKASFMNHLLFLTFPHFSLQFGVFVKFFILKRCCRTKLVRRIGKKRTQKIYTTRGHLHRNIRGPCSRGKPLEVFLKIYIPLPRQKNRNRLSKIQHKVRGSNINGKMGWWGLSVGRLAKTVRQYQKIKYRLTQR